EPGDRHPGDNFHRRCRTDLPSLPCSDLPYQKLVLSAFWPPKTPTLSARHFTQAHFTGIMLMHGFRAMSAQTIIGPISGLGSGVFPSLIFVQGTEQRTLY